MTLSNVALKKMRRRRDETSFKGLGQSKILEKIENFKALKSLLNCVVAKIPFLILFQRAEVPGNTVAR